MISPAPGQGFWPGVRLAFAYCVSFRRLDPSVQKCRTAVCRYYRLGWPASQKLQSSLRLCGTTSASTGAAIASHRHGRAWPGHPRLSLLQVRPLRPAPHLPPDPPPPPRAPPAVVRSALHPAPVMSHRPHSPRGDVSWLVVGHVVGMATYRVTPSADRVGFDVAVVGVGGFVQTTLGFTSEAAANAWVNQAMRLTKPWPTSRTFGRPKDQ
jgi:hypothetical protein